MINSKSVLRHQNSIERFYPDYVTADPRRANPKIFGLRNIIGQLRQDERESTLVLPFWFIARNYAVRIAGG